MTARRQTRSARPFPLHPALTHFPIALWTMTLICDVFSLRYGNVMVRAGFYSLVAGTAIAALTAVTGVIDYTRLPPEDPVRRTAIVHAFSMLAVVMVFFADLVLQMDMRNAARAPGIFVGLTAFGLCGMVLAAYLGHELVFDYGANVHLTHAPTSVVAEQSPIRRAPSSRPDQTQPVR
jgi:uncharacterized membrane protein